MPAHVGARTQARGDPAALYVSVTFESVAYGTTSFYFWWGALGSQLAR